MHLASNISRSTCTNHNFHIHHATGFGRRTRYPEKSLGPRRCWCWSHFLTRLDHVLTPTPEIVSAEPSWHWNHFYKIILWVICLLFKVQFKLVQPFLPNHLEMILIVWWPWFAVMILSPAKEIVLTHWNCRSETAVYPKWSRIICIELFISI